MLKLFRNQGKALRWIMGFILFLVAASMVITLVPNVFGPSGPASADVLAEVAGIPVTTGDVEVELRQYRSSEVPPEALSMMAGGVIENLISERVLFSEALALGLVPTEEDVANFLREQLGEVLFPDDQYIGARAYEGFIRQQFRRTVAEFEREILYNLAIEMRLRRMVTDNVSVSESEIRQRFHHENDAAKLEWVAVESSALRSRVESTPENLQQYFESNKLRYRHSERRAPKIMTVDPDAAASEYQISDAEIDLYYSQNQYRFEQPERVRMRHILLMTVDKSEEEAEAARAKAEEILGQLRGGADFAALAKEHSEDPGNADNGGDLGWVSRGDMVPEFEEAAFALQVGELAAAPVKTEFGYHLIRADDRESGSIKPLSEVREVIRSDLVAERSQNDRYALMERALEAAQQAGTALEGAASRMGLPYQEFPAFSRSELPEDLPKAAALVRAIFEEPTGEVFSVAQEDTLYIGIVGEVVAARDATYEEVADTVMEDYLDTESANLARARAEALAERVSETPDNFRLAAGREGLTPNTTDFVKRDADLGELGPVSALGETAFLAADGAIQGPVAIGDKWILFRTIEMQSAEESALAIERTTIRDAILGEKRTALFDYFRDEKLLEYAESGELVRYGDRIQAYLQSMQRYT